MLIIRIYVVSLLPVRLIMYDIETAGYFGAFAAFLT